MPMGVLANAADWAVFAPSVEVEFGQEFFFFFFFFPFRRCCRNAFMARFFFTNHRRIFPSFPVFSVFFTYFPVPRDFDEVECRRRRRFDPC